MDNNLITSFIRGITMKKSKILTLDQAMYIIKLVGFNMNKNELRIAAKLYVFMADYKAKVLGKDFLLDNDLFFNWLFSHDNLAPQGYVPISYFAKAKSISSAYVYALIRKKEIKPIILGGGRGKYFINAKEVKNILARRGIIEKSLVRRTKFSYKTRYDGYEDFLETIL